MRLCGRMSDGTLGAVEIDYITYDLVVPKENADDPDVVTLKATDVDGDQWFVDNIPVQDVEDIIEAITRHGYAIFSSEYTLRFEARDADYNDDFYDDDDLK